MLLRFFISEKKEKEKISPDKKFNIHVVRHSIRALSIAYTSVVPATIHFISQAIHYLPFHYLQIVTSTTRIACFQFAEDHRLRSIEISFLSDISFNFISRIRTEFFAHNKYRIIRNEEWKKNWSNTARMYVRRFLKYSDNPIANGVNAAKCLNDVK